jgi:hypothetical protein
LFSDNHDVIAADGRVADIGSFRGAGAFLDEHLTGDRESWREGDYLRFYLGTILIAARADLTPVYVMIFRRLKAPTPGTTRTVSGPVTRSVSRDILTSPSPSVHLRRSLPPNRVAGDQAYQNAKKHSDKQNAKIEHDKALARVILPS